MAVKDIQMAVNNTDMVGAFVGMSSILIEELETSAIKGRGLAKYC